MSKEYGVHERCSVGYKTLPKCHPPEPHNGRGEAACGHAPPVVCERTRAAAGLSKPHIRTVPPPYQKPKPTLTWYPGASLVEIHVPQDRPPKEAKEAPHVARLPNGVRPVGRGSSSFWVPYEEKNWPRPWWSR